MKVLILPFFFLAFCKSAFGANELCDQAAFIEARNCSEKEQEKAQKQLDTAYLQLLTIIPQYWGSEIDQSASGESSASEVTAALKKSQEAWELYRKATCEYKYETARGGTGTNSGHQQRLCNARLAYDRAAFLGDEAKWIEESIKATHPAR